MNIYKACYTQWQKKANVEGEENIDKLLDEVLCLFLLPGIPSHGIPCPSVGCCWWNCWSKKFLGLSWWYCRDFLFAPSSRSPRSHHLSYGTAAKTLVFLSNVGPVIYKNYKILSKIYKKNRNVSKNLLPNMHCIHTVKCMQIQKRPLVSSKVLSNDF